MKQIGSLRICLLAIMGVFLMFSNGCKQNTETGTVMDIDGNVYKTVTIGTQVWMAENLKTTKYNDGTAIPLVPDNKAWSNSSTPGYCWYDNDTSNKSIYGALYNWYVVNTGKLCPKGWHISTDAEWTTLISYLGGLKVAGDKLKSTIDWKGTDVVEASNSSGFSALPGDIRNFNGTFNNVGSHGYWWSASECDANKAWMRRLNYCSSDVFINSYPKADGMSVRCVMDN